MNWTCGFCGAISKTNRSKCTTCGRISWIPTPKRDISEVAGPMKRLTPRGLLLAKPGRQAPVQDPGGGIECGKCHMVIYKAEGVFDREAFEAARRRHYAASPGCESRERDSGKDTSPHLTV